MNLYYIHTEKYSPKSCVVNFDTQMSSGQSEEWTMVFTREKLIRPIRIANEVFYMWENDTSNQKPQRCVSCAPKFPPFLAAWWTSLRTHSRREVFFCLSMYTINTIPHVKCFVRYLPTRCFCIRNLTRSLRSLVRFLIQKQLVCKYRMPALLSA